MRIEDVVAIVFLGVIYVVLRLIFQKVFVGDLKISIIVFFFMLCCIFLFDLMQMFFVLLAMLVSDVVYFSSTRK